MDQLIVNRDHKSVVAMLIGKTREPHIQIVNATGEEKLPTPYVMTKAGPVFGFPAVVDYLQHRITAPLLLDTDPMRRGLQMTIFYRLLNFYFPQLLLGQATESQKFVKEVSASLGYGQFYTGPQFSICDAALYAALKHAKDVHHVTSPMVDGYLNRCDAFFAAILDLNSREHYADDDFDDAPIR